SVNDDQVLVEDGRSRRAPVAHVSADIGPPDFLAVEIEAIDTRRPEEGVQVLAVGCRRARRVTVVIALIVVVLRFGERRLELLGPEDRAASAVKADDVAFEVRHAADVLAIDAVAGVTGEVDAFADDDRAGCAGARE